MLAEGLLIIVIWTGDASVPAEECGFAAVIDCFSDSPDDWVAAGAFASSPFSSPTYFLQVKQYHRCWSVL
jgi:hypothetical protein